MKIINVVEKNINGCGEDAMVSFLAADVSDEDIENLSKYLNEIKEREPITDTDDMVSKAVERSGIKYIKECESLLIEF